MANNFVQMGAAIEFVAVADVLNSEVVVTAGIIGISNDSTLTGETGVLHIEGVFEVPKIAAGAIGNMASVDYDLSAKKFGSGITPAAGDVSDCGICIGGALDTATTMLVKINTGSGTVA
jgi:predicted RecA/RadA family phage recombinase